MAKKVAIAPTTRNSFFAKTEKPQGLFVPEIPIFIQANCAQAGSWVQGETMLGNSPLEFYILAFQYGEEYDPYKDKMRQMGTIWFTPIDNDPLKAKLVYAVKIKNQDSGRKGSLFNFGGQVASLVVAGFDPREVIWEASFVKKSGSLPSGETYSCAVLDFAYRFPEAGPEIAILEDCVRVFEDDVKLLHLQAATLPSVYALPEGQ